MQADEGQDAGGDDRPGVEGEDAEEHHHQHWLLLRLQGAGDTAAVHAGTRGEEKEEVSSSHTSNQQTFKKINIVNEFISLVCAYRATY